MKRATHTHFEPKWWNNMFDGEGIDAEMPVVEPPAAPFDLEPTVQTTLRTTVYHP